MEIFKDRDGQEWKLALTIDLADEIFRRCERPDSTPEERRFFDLLSVNDSDQAQYLQPFKDGRIDRLYLERLINVIYVMLEKQCKERKVSEYAFAELLQGEALGRCLRAFQSEVVNFIPIPEYQELVRTAMSVAGGVDLTVLKSVNDRMNTLNSARVAGIGEALDTRTKIYEERMQKELVRLKAEAVEYAKKEAEALEV